ncbi:MAG: M20/M25/M40 family metallo-hydrolase, partial [Synergistaceae bacterium]|nr:M20/M25/M40 family metallo-hydrolase [Synergistaceae bacterium]
MAQIPAPSNHEEKRAEFCRRWLEDTGAKGVFIDEALNVVYPINCEKAKKIVVIMAHTDVVFPDTEKLPLEMREGKIFAPGAGDDTANLSILLMTARYITQNHLKPDIGLVIVANSGEEGLGNLKGARKIMETYGDRVK